LTQTKAVLLVLMNLGCSLTITSNLDWRKNSKNYLKNSRIQSENFSNKSTQIIMILLTRVNFRKSSSLWDSPQENMTLTTTLKSMILIKMGSFPMKNSRKLWLTDSIKICFRQRILYRTWWINSSWLIRIKKGLSISFSLSKCFGTKFHHCFSNFTNHFCCLKFSSLLKI
jgi:hypothetical protein